jgi:energy-coupling factor transporter transmembrane protein EcfT
LAFFCFLIWVVLTIIACKCAKNRGRSAGKWLVFCLFLSPVIALVAIFCLKDLEKEAKEEEQRAMQNQISSRSFVHSMNNLVVLLQQGMINEREFSDKKLNLMRDLFYIIGSSESPDEFLVALIPFLKNEIITQDEMDMSFWASTRKEKRRFCQSL